MIERDHNCLQLVLRLVSILFVLLGSAVPVGHEYQRPVIL